MTLDTEKQVYCQDLSGATKLPKQASTSSLRSLFHAIQHPPDQSWSLWQYFLPRIIHSSLGTPLSGLPPPTIASPSHSWSPSKTTRSPNFQSFEASGQRFNAQGFPISPPSRQSTPSPTARLWSSEPRAAPRRMCSEVSCCRSLDCCRKTKPLCFCP